MPRLLTRENTKLTLVAMACLTIAWTGPAVAHGVHAKFAHDADKVDGKHAVGAGAGLATAKGKLVAHDKQGQLPAKFIPTVRNSEKVGGRRATDLANRLYRYTIPPFEEGNTTFHSLSFPDLPPGRYLASYTVTLSTQGEVTCAFRPDLDTYEVGSVRASAEVRATFSGTGLVDTRDRPHPFVCDGNAFSYINVDETPHFSSVTFLRVDQVVDGPASGPAPL